MKSTLTLVAVCLSLCSFAQKPSIYSDQPLAHTFSIVAYDPVTGDMGVAVQSHWFSVGTIVAWGEAGVGVIATQSFVNPEFGPKGLSLMKQGMSAQEVLNKLIKVDKGSAYRQLGIVDAKGNAATFTGENCIEAAGHWLGDGYATQANMMKNDQVWSAMAVAFEASKGQPLAERLVAALEAAQGVGGDIRGQQSAALLVVSAQNTGKPWIDRKVDLRVDDHTAPIVEIKRLLKVHRAYEFMNRGDVQMEEGKIEEALQSYNAASTMFPENLEMKFWTAVNLANIGKVEEALPMFQAIFKKNEDWKELLKRLPKSGLLKVSNSVFEKILRLE
ncbi:MAG: DUF1028 domain-containing protein [Saprospiraceae bacterium]|nr:DUF1028 domain-containing protein [Saprospiraceae bacterium]